MNGPGVRRALPPPDGETLRMAFVSLATQAVVIAELRAEIAERDRHIEELRAMVERACT